MSSLLTVFDSLGIFRGFGVTGASSSSDPNIRGLGFRIRPTLDKHAQLTFSKFLMILTNCKFVYCSFYKEPDIEHFRFLKLFQPTGGPILLHSTTHHYTLLTELCQEQPKSSW